MRWIRRILAAIKRCFGYGRATTGCQYELLPMGDDEGIDPVVDRIHVLFDDHDYADHHLDNPLDHSKERGMVERIDADPFAYDD